MFLEQFQGVKLWNPCDHIWTHVNKFGKVWTIWDHVKMWSHGFHTFTPWKYSKSIMFCVSHILHVILTCDCMWLIFCKSWENHPFKDGQGNTRKKQHYFSVASTWISNTGFSPGGIYSKAIMEGMELCHSAQLYCMLIFNLHWWMLCKWLS